MIRDEYRERNAFAFKIGEGSFEAVRTKLGELWPQITALLDELGCENFSLWQIGDLVFGYYETEGRPILSEGNEDRLQGFIDVFRGLGEWISTPKEKMRLMYEDFGVVRKSKELIRHRVFATQLVGDYQEEYKARHDRLVEARNGVVTRGPDSNFSIWNAGRYIFGYDEIDVTMEKAETEESRQATIAWETKMLEIMEWFSDDVDWITNERHPHVVRLAWHPGH